MRNDGGTIVHGDIDKILSIIKEIDILMEQENDQIRVLEMLHLKEQLIDLIKKKSEEHQSN